MIGVLFATEREAGPLVRQLGARPLGTDPFPCWAFSTAQDEEGLILVCGMGKDAAARGVEHLVTARGVTEILNPGICGAAADDIEIGSLFRIIEARDGDEPDEGSWQCTPGRWGALPAARLTSFDEPVFDLGRHREIAVWGELVDMEGAAVARACQEHEVPCTLLKGVSDLADDGGREVLLRNIDAVSETVAAAILEGIPAATPAARPDSLGVKLLRFTKIEHTVFSLPLLFTGAWLGAGQQMPPLRALLLIALAGVGARVMGMSMNRVLDRRLDALNPRTAARELPSGQMSLAVALLVAGAGLATYLLACALLGPLVLSLSPIPAAALIGYSLLKRFTSLCHFGIGVCLGLAPVGAYVAVSGDLQLGPEILLLAAFTFCWISGFDIIYALQDIAADRANGVHSVPAALGSGRAQGVAAAVHAVALAGAIGLVLISGGGPLAWIAWLVAAGAFVGAYLPMVPLPARFFPLSAIAGIAGALVPLLGRV